MAEDKATKVVAGMIHFIMTAILVSGNLLMSLEVCLNWSDI